LQSFWEITSDDYLAYISNYVVGLGPWKDTIVSAANNYLMAPSDLVARAHAHDLQVWFFIESFDICLYSLHLSGVTTFINTYKIIRTSCANFLCIHYYSCEDNII
jgi:hypothetical protein